jgi:signal peptidase I
LASTRNQIKEWAKAIVTALVLIILLRTFVAEVYTIPTSSMENTLLSGDFVLVSKISYGPRLPITPLSVPFFHQSLSNKEHIPSFRDWIQLPYFRLPGLSSISRNDIIVFNYPIEEEYPIDHRSLYVKRCIGLPGDTIEIQSSLILVNSDTLAEPGETKYNYHIKSIELELPEDVVEKYNINAGNKVSNQGDYRFSLTSQNAEELSRNPQISHISRWSEKKNNHYDFIFPYSPDYPWNIDNFGPVVIPAKGRSIKISPANLPLYERIIRNYENNTIEIINDSIFINNLFADTYAFQKDYYFVLGDNRHYSSDSRFWGFIPEDHIAGKTIRVLFSLETAKNKANKFRFNRILKGLN